MAYVEILREDLRADRPVGGVPSEDAFLEPIVPAEVGRGGDSIATHHAPDHEVAEEARPESQPQVQGVQAILVPDRLHVGGLGGPAIAHAERVLQSRAAAAHVSRHHEPDLVHGQGPPVVFKAIDEGTLGGGLDPGAVVKGLVPVAQARMNPAQDEAVPVARGKLDLEPLDLDGRGLGPSLLHVHFREHAHALGEGRGQEEVDGAQGEGGLAVFGVEVHIAEALEDRSWGRRFGRRRGLFLGAGRAREDERPEDRRERGSPPARPRGTRSPEHLKRA